MERVYTKLFPSLFLPNHHHTIQQTQTEDNKVTRPSYTHLPTQGSSGPPHGHHHRPSFPPQLRAKQLVSAANPLQRRPTQPLCKPQDKLVLRRERERERERERDCVLKRVSIACCSFSLLHSDSDWFACVIFFPLCNSTYTIICCAFFFFFSLTFFPLRHYCVRGNSGRSSYL